MAKEEQIKEEEVSTEAETTEKPKKGAKIMLFIVGLVAILQCGVLFVIFQDEITTFFENMKPEPVEVTLYYPLEEMSVNLADKDSRHFLKATLSLEYKDETLTAQMEERKADIQSTILEVLRSKKYEEVDSVEDTRQLAAEIVETLNILFETEAFSNVHFTEYLYQ